MRIGAKIVGNDRMGRPIRQSDPYLRVMAQTERQGDCLVFTGCRNRAGYGRVSLGDNRQALAHRVVWRRHNPTAPEPSVVMHTCDNPPCVERMHLQAGTRAENSADMVAKGRSPLSRGERSGRAKLTSEQVAEIIRLRSAGHTTVAIAAQFGIHFAHVSRITRGQRRAYG
jgi:hypothetical protein